MVGGGVPPCLVPKIEVLNPVLIIFSSKINVGCGKKSLDSKSHRKIPADTPENTRRYTGKKYRNIYVDLPRYRVSQHLFDEKFVET